MSGVTIHARFRIPRKDFVLDVDLALPGTGVTAVFGPSGCGKTTFLRALAGLERAPGGYTTIGNEVWQDDSRGLFVPPHRRALGYVFQEASLFDHLSVRQNMEFGLRRTPSALRAFRTAEVAELLGVSALLDRMPAGLSGGERQRVAIARALLSTPRLLLMDEPLAALDLKRKREILPYLQRLHAELSIPVVYVSHAPGEVARLADHLVLLDGGHVAAHGPLGDTLARIDLPAAFSDNAGVVLDTVLASHEPDHLSRLEFPGGHMLVAQRPEAAGAHLRCRIYARDVSLALDRPLGTSITNLLPATVVAVAPTHQPGHVLVQLRLGETLLLARISERSRRELAVEPGLRVWAQIKAVAPLA